MYDEQWYELLQPFPMHRKEVQSGIASSKIGFHLKDFANFNSDILQTLLTTLPYQLEESGNASVLTPFLAGQSPRFAIRALENHQNITLREKYKEPI